MLKKLMALTLLTSIIALPASSSHLGCYTNYITNGGFNDSSAPWQFLDGAYWETNLDDPCDLYFGYKMKAAALTVGNAWVSQDFTTSSHFALSWSLNFEVQTQSFAGATNWDELRILVQDLTTGQTEVLIVKGAQLTSTCQRFDFRLAKDYSGHRVRLSFNAQPFTSLDMYIDNVAFFGQYC